METFADNLNKHINRNSNPDLALYYILESTKIKMIWRWCLIYLKNNSICKRDLFKAAIISGDNPELFDKILVFFPFQSQEI